jgi:nicotinate-nucleotide pyrophosphorylase
MLEKYAVLLGGGVNSRYGLDDGVRVRGNHAAIAGGLSAAVKHAVEQIGHIHRVAAEVSTKDEIKAAIEAGATVLVLPVTADSEVKDQIDYARQLLGSVLIEISGDVTLDGVRKYAEAGADIIAAAALTQSVRAMDISFQIQLG